MPMLERVAAISRSVRRMRRPVSTRKPTVSPSTRTSPSSYSSRKLMHRSSVVCPEPLGPMIATISPRETVRDTSFRTRWRPKLMLTRRSSTIGRSCAAGSVGKAHPLLEVENVAGERVAQHEVDESDAAEDLQGRECPLRHLAAGECQLPEADDGDERRALDEKDARVHEGGSGETEHLRVDDDPEHEPAAHPKAPGSVPLRAGQGEDRRPEDLRHERSEVERHDEHTAEEW